MMLWWTLLLCACLSESAPSANINGVRYICLQHLGSFELQWRILDLQKSGLGQQPPLPHPIGQARCQNLTHSQAFSDGDNLSVEVLVRRNLTWSSTPIETPVVYNSSSLVWITITCHGSAEAHSCNIGREWLPNDDTSSFQTSGDTCSLPVTDRTDCGENSTTKEICMSKGCCWQQVSPNPTNASWCFRKGPAGGGPAPPNKPLPFAPAECFFAHPSFDVSNLILQKDIVYGSAVNPYFMGLDKTEILKLDILSPPSADRRKLRPAMVFIHGGGFTGGDKGADQGFREIVAAHGYVVLSINYRMVTDGAIPAVWDLLTIKPAQVAAQDARAAVRYLKKHASELRVDPNRIIVAGESAGAITSNFYGFVKGSTDGFSGNAGYDSSINAVISVSGSMRDLAFCASIGPAPKYQPFLCAVSSPPGRDLTKELGKGDIAIIDIHGTRDQTIPYIAGEEMIHRAAQVGVENLLLTIPGAGHVPWGNILDPNEPYLLQLLKFASASLNLAEAECPAGVASVVV